jgi:hypothetical protein
MSDDGNDCRGSGLGWLGALLLFFFHIVIAIAILFLFFWLFYKIMLFLIEVTDLLNKCQIKHKATVWIKSLTRRFETYLIRLKIARLNRAASKLRRRIAHP